VLSCSRSVRLRCVQIILDVSQDEDGRAVGTVRAKGQTDSRPFSGNLELLALIEDLYRNNPDTTGEDTGPSDKEQS
jgi:hypothetical protein